MPSKRTFLGIAAAALTGTVASAGCLSVPSGSGTPDESTPTGEAPDTTSEPTSRTDNPPTTEYDPKGPVRSEADAITVEQTITDSKYTYVESNNTVRYPATMSGGEISSYGYEPFQDWTKIEGASVAAQRIRDDVAAEVDASGALGAGISAGEDGSLVISVTLTTHLDREGNVISEPDASFSEVVAATPSSAESTIHFAEKSGTHTHEVWVRERVIQND